MKLMLIRTERGLHGATPDDHDGWLRFKARLSRMRLGQYLRMDFSSPRNGKHHNKIFVLLELIVQNSEVYDTKERALVAVKLAAGFFDPIVDPETGDVQKVPHSIAYDSMGQEDFARFYSAALHGVLTYILPQFDEPTALRLMDEIVAGWMTEAPR